MTPEPALRELLALEPIGADVFRSTDRIVDEAHNLYGGQVAAQALVAAGVTVDPERLPISLHGAYMRPGDSSQPVEYHVLRDRDGRRFSSRRVEAVQHGTLIFTASVSLQTPETDAPTRQMVAPFDLPPPEECDPYDIPRLRSFEGRWLPQPFDYGEEWVRRRWPTRFWARCTDPGLARDPLLDAAAFTYLSDISSATAVFDDGGWWTGPSIDHAVWLHTEGASAGWVLVDLEPIQVRAGRGLYFGSISNRDGRIIASLAQETLHRPFPVRPRGED